MDGVEIVHLVLEAFTIFVVLANAKTIRDKLHFVNRTIAAVEKGIHSRVRDLIGTVTHNTMAAKDDLSVLVVDTEKNISKRLSEVVPDLEEFVQYQRRAYISTLCHYDYLVPTSFLKMLVDSNRMSAVAQETEYLKELQNDILHNGLREPLIVAYDDRGQMMLQEGHHRLRVMDGFPALPVRLKKVPKSAGTFNPMNVERLFKTFSKENYVET